MYSVSYRHFMVFSVVIRQMANGDSCISPVSDIFATTEEDGFFLFLSQSRSNNFWE